MSWRESVPHLDDPSRSTTLSVAWGVQRALGDDLVVDHYLEDIDDGITISSLQIVPLTVEEVLVLPEDEGASLEVCHDLGTNSRDGHLQDVIRACVGNSHPSLHSG